MLSVAVSAPVIDGVNVTAIVHVALLAIVPVHVEVPMAKSAAFVPIIVTFEIVSALPVRFASVTSNGWLAAPSTCLPKFSDVGLKITPVAAAGESLATNAAPVLNVVWNAPVVTGKSDEPVMPVT